MNASSGPEERNFSAISCGTYKGKSIVWLADQFMTDAGGTLKKIEDQYEVSRELYCQLKDSSGWTHADAAEAFGISSRTAEGMSQGRISMTNRRKLAKMLTL